MKAFKLGIILALSFYLWGCAPGNVRSTVILEDEPLAAGQGVVAIQVANNGPRLGEYNQHWTSVTLMRIDNFEELKADARARGARTSEGDVRWEPDFYALRAYNGGFLENRLFVGAVPEGTYMVLNLFSYFNNGEVESRMSMPVRRMGGTFTVEDARYTDLGTLVFQPLGDISRPNFWTSRQQRDAFVTRVESVFSHRDFVEQAYPQLAQGVDFSSPLGWQSDALDDFRQQLSQVVAENAYGNNMLALNAAGKVAFPVRLGQVHVFGADGEPYTEQLPTQTHILAAMELDNKRVYAGEEGRVYIREHGSSDWRTYQPIGQNQVIEWMGKLAQGYAAKVSDGRARNIYRFDSFSEGWELVDSTELTVGFFDMRNPGTYNPLVTSDGKLRIIGEGETREYDPVTRQWSVESGPRLKDVQILPNGVVVAMSDTRMTIPRQVLSRDDGLTWENLGQQRRLAQDIYQYSGLPVPLADGSTMVIARQDVGSQGIARFQPARVPPDSWRDQSAWTFSGQLPEGCNELVVQLTSADDFYLHCQHGDIKRSRDQGRTWEPLININMQAMRARFDALIEALSEDEDEGAVEEQPQTTAL